MRTVLIERSNGHDQAWIARQVRCHINPAQFIETETRLARRRSVRFLNMLHLRFCSEVRE